MRSVLNWGPAIKRIALSTNWTRPAFLYCKLNGTEQAIRSTLGYYMTGKMAARSFTLCLLLFVIGLKITREMQTASGMTNTVLSSACTNALWVLPRCLGDLLLLFFFWMIKIGFKIKRKVLKHLKICWNIYDLTTYPEVDSIFSSVVIISVHSSSCKEMKGWINGPLTW